MESDTKKRNKATCHDKAIHSQCQMQAQMKAIQGKRKKYIRVFK